jgi:hypothetical protein
VVCFGVAFSHRTIGAAAISLWISACGSSTSDSLFAGAGGKGATANGGENASDAGHGATRGAGGAGGGALLSGGTTATGSGGASDTDAASSSGGAPSGAGGTMADSGTPPGTGGRAATGGAAGSGTSTPGTVACVGGPCTGTCCRGALAGVECLPLICPSGGAALACDDRADCTGGKLCCGSIQKGASCAATCTGGQLCRTNDECQSGQCRPLGEDPRYSECK